MAEQSTSLLIDKFHAPGSWANRFDAVSKPVKARILWGAVATFLAVRGSICCRQTANAGAIKTASLPRTCFLDSQESARPAGPS